MPRVDLAPKPHLAVRALATLGEMRGNGIKANEYSYSAAIAACGKGGQWELTLSLLDEMRAAGLPPNVYVLNAVVAACKAQGHREAAAAIAAGRDLVEGGQTSWPNSLSFNAAITTARRSVDART